MASAPDEHPDSMPESGPASTGEAPDQLSPCQPEPGQNGVTPPDSPGMPAGTAGTGGVNKAQEDLDH